MELKAATVAQDYTFAQEQYNHDSRQPENLMVVHQDFNVHDFSKHLPTRRRLVGTMTTGDLPSFLQYVNQRIKEEGAELNRTFIDTSIVQNQLTAVAVLNFGETSVAGHADDKAVLNLTKDPMYTAFKDVFEDENFSTLKFAEALEDMLGDLPMKAFNGSEEQSIATAIAIIRNTKSDSNQSSTVSATQFKSEVSEFERIEVSSTAGALPTHIVISTPMYLGLEEQTIAYKVKVESVPAGDNKTKLQFSLRPTGVLAAYLKAGESFKNLIGSDLGTETTTIGSYKAG